LDFNPSKEKRLGSKINPGKLIKKAHKSWEQLKRHDPDVEISNEVTEHLLVSNSSALCGVSLEELEEIFRPFDDKASFVFFPSKRSYSFVSFSSKERASTAREALNGVAPVQLKVSHQPFVISYVKQCERTELSVISLVLPTGSGEWKSEPLKHRDVIHYGYKFDYSANSAFIPTNPIPEAVNRLTDRIVDDGLINFRLDQVTINVYKPGQGIPSHYDTHSAFEDTIVCLSMCSDIVMEFKDGANSSRICPVLLKRRSLCIMKGESRYRWKHGIVNRRYDINPITHRVMPRELRVSITLRKIRREPCQCQFKEYCDWDRGGEMGVPSDEISARKVESLYVNGVYECIASHFDETRFSSWRAVNRFMSAVSPYSVVYDVGCGNGKYLAKNDNLLKIGCDMSQMLCQIVSAKGFMIIRADALCLPFREDADAVLSIAVLHHMASLSRRQKAIREILRVLKPGGKACISVWALDQSNSEYSKMRRHKDSSLDGKQSGRLKIHDGREFIQQDLLVPWQIEHRDETYFRYYHVFTEGEIEELIRSVGGCQIDSVEKEQGNYVAVITKLQKD
uniref:tRNA (carboxymethyluridine(34)-5-O)-methyltransferase n=1 Tax=Angiostrongylus cantonensis TaxID=6313 RepID=A0A158P998_ANGCA